jgi:hypothetical protein
MNTEEKNEIQPEWKDVERLFGSETARGALAEKMFDDKMNRHLNMIEKISGIAEGTRVSSKVRDMALLAIEYYAGEISESIKKINECES